MSHAFDASLAGAGPVSEEAQARQRREVEGWERMPSALANAKLHAQRELERLVGSCNRLAWGYGAFERRAPEAGEVAELFGRLGAEGSGRFGEACRQANEQRHLIVLIEEAERRYAEQLRREQIEMTRIEAEKQEWAAFEAYDAAGKQARFAAWRAQRGGAQ